MRRLLLGACVVLALASCSSRNDQASTGPTGTHVAVASTTSTSTSVQRTTSTAGFEGDTVPVSVPASSDQQRTVTDVRVGTHDTFDRVVFEFDNGVPGYTVRYIDKPVRADASNAEVPVDGNAVVEVRFEPALAHDIEGPVKTEFAQVVEVVKTGDFEAVVHFAIGVKSKAAFHASVVDGTKLVIDVAHD